MARVVKSALVAYPAEHLFDLICDVERYPEFLPWCRSARLLSRSETEFCGEIEVSKVGVTQTFATCNVLHRPERMEIRLLRGPFRKLEGVWDFLVLRPDACKVSLALEFEFSNRLMDRAFGMIFEQIANTMVDAFCRRAAEIPVEP
jgi:ribosome-associated toxin RatA of RatAB toxin-antitoxin module